MSIKRQRNRPVCNAGNTKPFRPALGAPNHSSLVTPMALMTSV